MSKTYKTAEACRALDVQPYVLRYWETEFAALGGKKSSPQRTYTEDEVTILKRIKVLLYDEGYTMGGAKKKLATELEETDAGPSALEGSSQRTEPGRTVKVNEEPTPVAPSKSKPKAKTEPKAAKRATTKTKTTTAEKQESLDTGDPVQIETVLLELRKLHTEAEQILSLVRASK